MHARILLRAVAVTAAALLLTLPGRAQGKNPKTTFCNPLDLVVPGERAYRG